MISKIKRIFGCEYRIVISEADFERLSSLYDELYEKASLVLAKYDPCRIRDGECLRGEPCCDDSDGRCKYFSNECTVKSLACRLWLCDEAREAFPECAIALDELKKIAKDSRFLDYRASKKDIFSDYEIGDE